MGTSIDRFLDDERKKREARTPAPPPITVLPVAPTAPTPTPQAPLAPPLSAQVESSRILGVPLTPLDASAVLDLSARTGYPSAAVIADRKKIAEEQARLKAPTDMVLRQAPHLSEWVAKDPARAALVEPDLSELSAIEYSMGRIRNDFLRGAIRDRMTDPVMRIIEGKAQLDDEATIAALQKQIDELPFYDQAGTVTKALGMTAEQLAQMGNSLTEAGGALAVGYGAATLAQRAGPAGMAAGTAAKKLMGPLFVMGQAQASGRRMAVEAFLEYRGMKDEQGNRLLTDEEIKGVAVIVGAFGGALEVTGMLSIASVIPGVRGMLSKSAVKQLLANPTTRSAFLMYARGVVTGMAGEAITEGLQDLTTQFGGKLVETQREAYEGMNPTQLLDHLFSDYDWERTGTAAAMGGTVGLVLGGSTGALGLGLDIRRARQAEQFATRVEQVAQGIAQTGVAKSGTPDQLAEVIGTLMRDGQQSVWLDSQAFTQLFQNATDAGGNAVNPSEVAALLLGGKPAAYEDALADSGASFEVPISEVLAKLAVRDEGMRAWVLDNVQESPMAMSRAESRAMGGEALTKKLEELDTEAEASAADPAEQLLADVEQHMLAGLKAAKRSKREQRMGAALATAQFRSLLAQGVPLARVRELAITNLGIYGETTPSADAELSPEQQAAVDAAETALGASVAPEVDATGTPVTLSPAEAAERRRQGMIALGDALAQQPFVTERAAPVSEEGVAPEADPLEQPDPERWTPLSEAEQALEDSLQKQRRAIIRARDYLARKGKLSPDELQMLSTLEQYNPLPPTLEIDGVQRPTTDSTGGPIALTEAAVRNFWRWFGDSKVVDEQGRPRVVYHGTNAFVNFDKFDINIAQLGVHVGTEARQANTLLFPGGGTMSDMARVYPLYVRAENPLRLQDRSGAWNARSAGQQMVDLKIITPERLFEIAQKPSDAAQGKLLRQEIRKAGYDSVVYLNRFEGIEEPGGAKVSFTAVWDREDMSDEAFKKEAPLAEDSYILLDRKQLKSAFGNNGEFRDSNDATILEQPLGTRLPSSKKKGMEDPVTQRTVIDLESMRRDPKTYEKNVKVLRKYRHLRPIAGETLEETAERFVQFVTENLLWLHDQMPPEIAARAKLWYDGANALVNRLATQFNLSEAQVSGVMAALSPQKDWYQNVTSGRRVIEILHNHQNTKWTPAMSKVARRKSRHKNKTTGVVSVRQKLAEKKLRRVSGKTLGELKSPLLKAYWLRIYDETYNTRAFPIVTPEGGYGELVKTNAGKNRGFGWGSYAEIAKAISIVEDGSPENISRVLSKFHKIRNFYNNIFNPMSLFGEVTIDTHAVAGGLLSPFSGKSIEVKHNFGSGGVASSAILGTSGTYVFHAEAYRRAAAARGLLPREMQSITWEAARGLFTDVYKRGKGNVSKVERIWNKYRKGQLSITEARAAILKLAGGVNHPTWVGSGAGLDEGGRRVDHPRLVPGVRGDGGVGSRRGAGIDAAAGGAEVLNQAVPVITPGPLWYSALERAVEKMKMPAMPANEWWSWLTGSSHKTGVKREELDAVGVEEWLALRSSGIAGVDGARVTKEELLAFIRENGVQLAEGMTGGDQVTQRKIRELQNRLDEIEVDIDGLENDAFHTDDIEELNEIDIEESQLKLEAAKILLEIEQLKNDTVFATPVFEDDYSSVNTAEEGSYRELGMTLPYPRGAERWTIDEETVAGDLVYHIKKNGDYMPTAYRSRTEAKRALHEAGLDPESEIRESEASPYTVHRVRNRAGEIVHSAKSRRDAQRYIENARQHTAKFENIQHNFRIIDADINRIAQVRFNVQRDAKGNRVLHIDEIQSDWAQAGRKQGWASEVTAEAEAKLAELRDAIDRKHNEWMTSSTAMDLALGRYSDVRREGRYGHATRREQLRSDLDFLVEQFRDATAFAKALDSWLETVTRWPVYLKKEVRANALVLHEYRQLQEERDALFAATKGAGVIEAAPFVQDTQSWTALVLKRMIRYAAENGFDRISWTTGKDQVTRYEQALRKRVDKIVWTKTKEGVQLVGYKQGDEVLDTTEKETVLSDAIGKAMADQILSDPNQTGTIEGKSITIDDTGMASFYDQIVPLVANKLLRQLGGGKVETVTLGTGTHGTSALVFADDVAPMSVAEFTALRADIKRQLDNFHIDHAQTDSAQADALFRVLNKAKSILYSADNAMDDDGFLAPRDAIAQELRREFRHEEIGHKAGFIIKLGDILGGKLLWKENAEEKQSFVVTPAMKETAINGLPLFQPKKAKAVGPRGRIYRYPSGRFDIQLLEAADESTFMHEMAHFFLAIRSQLASEEGAPAALVADLGALNTWLANDHQALRTEAMGYLQTAYQIESAVGADGTPMFVITDPRGRREAFADEESAKLVGEARRAATLKDLLSMDEDMIRETVTRRSIRGARADSEALLSVAMEERFARGFELYLREGKAPSLELRNVFSALAAWLTKIYRSFQQLNVTLTPEVRAVMDRMLATETEIAQAQATQGERPLFTHQTTADLVAVGFTESDAAKYVALLNEAKVTAHEEMRAQLMKDITRLDAKWWKEERARVEKLATDAAHAMPIYRAWSLLQTGRLPDGTEQPGLPPRFKLDRDAAFDLAPVAIVDGEPRSALEDLKGRRVFEKNGLNPDLVAGLLGYPNGQVLIAELLKAQPMKEKIQVDTDAKMNEIFPPNLEQATEVAAEALHTNEREAVLRHELKVLAKMNLKGMMGAMKRLSLTLPERAEVVALARRIISRKRIDSLNAHEYLQGEAKAAKLSAAAVAKGDWLEAIQQKQRQILNHALWREATAMKAQMKKDQALIGKIFRADTRVAKSRDVNLVNVARTVLARVGLGRGDATPESYLAKLADYDAATFQQLQPLLETGVAPRQDPRTLTVAEYLDTMTVVEAFWRQAKGMKDISVRGRKVALEDVVTDLTNDLEKKGNGPLARAGHSQAFTATEKVHLMALGIKASLRRVESWVDMMDGGDLNGVWRQYIWEPISEAGVRFRLKRDEMVVAYKALLEPLQGTLTGKKVLAPELGYTFRDKAELLGALLHTGNRGEGSNFDKLIRGRATLLEAENKQREEAGLAPLPALWTEDNFERMVDRLIADGTLTAQDFAFLQGVWNLFESRKPAAQRVHQAMVGYFFNEVTATPFTNQFGTFAGGYFPARADSTLSIDAQTREDESAMKASVDLGMFPTPPRDFTKNRTNQYAAPLIMDLDLVVMHIDAVELFIAMSEPSRDVQRILLHKGFAAKLKAFDPAVGSDMLAPWVHRTAKQTVTTPTRGQGGKGFDATARFVRGTASLNAMAANVVNTLQQITGLSIAMLKVKPRFLAAALVRVMRHPKDMTEAVNTASEFMRSRNAAQLFEARQAIEKIVSDQSAMDTVRESAQKHGYFMQVTAQNFVDNIVWLGAYEEALEGGLDPKTAQRSADSAVRLTQGSFAPEDISRAATGNAFARIFTMYFDYFNMQANILGTEIGKLAYNGVGLKQNAGRAFFVVLMGFTIPAFLGEVISAGMRDELPDKEDDGYLGDWLKFFFTSQARTATAFVPGAGQVAAMVVALGNDKFYDDRLSVTPVASMLESAGRGVYATTKVFGDEEFKRRDIKDILSLLSLATRIPLAPLARPTQYLFDVESGATRPTGPVDFTRGILAGR